VSCHAPIEARGALVACAYCPGCRSKRSASWAVRLSDEEREWDRASFVTLTISDRVLFRCWNNPPNPARLSRRDLQLFFKRLRKAGYRVKYYAVGEYGEKFARAHYHLVLFGADSRDRVALEAAWPWGNVDIGRVEPASIRYVTGYVMKAPLGRLRLHEEREGHAPAFSVMSRGIGAVGGNARRHTITTQGVIRVGNRAVVPPRFYLRGLSEADRQAFLLARRQRQLERALARVAAGGEYVKNDVQDRAQVSRADFKARQKPRGVL